MTLTERFMSYVMPEPNSGCWLWIGNYGKQQNKKFSYGRICIDYVTRMAHHLSHEIFKGPIPNGLLVRHKCDVPGCVNPDHLEIGTHYDNARDRTLRGRTLQGERHPKAILTEDDVRIIKKRISQGEGITRIAFDFSVSYNAIYEIKMNRTWRFVA